jgi:hypothetical protein
MKFSYPLYLPNGGQLRKNKHTTRLKTLKNAAGVRPLQTPK